MNGRGERHRASPVPRLPASVNPPPRKPVDGICSESVVDLGSYVVEVDAEGGQQFGVGQWRAADRVLQGRPNCLSVRKELSGRDRKEVAMLDER